MINHWISGYPIFRPNTLAIFGPCLPKHMPFPRRIAQPLRIPNFAGGPRGWASQTAPLRRAAWADPPSAAPGDSCGSGASVPTRSDMGWGESWAANSKLWQLWSFSGEKRENHGKHGFLVDWHSFLNYFFELRQLAHDVRTCQNHLGQEAKSLLWIENHNSKRPPSAPCHFEKHEIHWNGDGTWKTSTNGWWKWRACFLTPEETRHISKDPNSPAIRDLDFFRRIFKLKRRARACGSLRCCRIQACVVHHMGKRGIRKPLSQT